MNPGMIRSTLSAVLCVAGLATADASAQVNVTEWLYQGRMTTSSASTDGGEYVEITNTGTTPVDFTGWSFDDANPVAGTIDLSGFGVVQPGESVIISDGLVDVAAFRDNWNLAPTVKVISSGAVGFGRGDEYNLFNSFGTLVEKFAYSDETYPGTVRARAAVGDNGSGNIPLSELGSLTATTGMPKSFIGDSFGSYASDLGEIGNPGLYVVPEPATLGAAVAGLAMLVRRSRR